MLGTWFELELNCFYFSTATQSILEISFEFVFLKLIFEINLNEFVEVDGIN